jgi:hypothetical protein
MDSTVVSHNYKGSPSFKRIKVDCASNDGAGNTLVAAVENKRIRVISAILIGETAVDMTFYSGAADTGTALTGTMSIAETGGFVLNPVIDHRIAWMETESGEALSLLLGDNIQVSGCLVYALVD